jgi:hypothetical protein
MSDEYLSNAQVRARLRGGMSYSAFARLRKKPGFPQPNRAGLYRWGAIEAWMDGPRRRNVTSSPLSQEEEIKNAAQNYMR